MNRTRASIAGLALLSTWVAYEMSVIRQSFENTGNPALAAGAGACGLLVRYRGSTVNS
jgi:hypothetical protein